ncbi:ABC transporter ATP-binding protein [Bifidobacterium catenulatum subsp. kashiwanohense]|uniref:ABC transporter ATP-binding protein n=1 Tax=Bifidobacterium catenulatum TaxID=1686 RepID=UPI0026ED31C8|nr:ABC transporter ATP-binding protein [Bifidobacterium catenulatum]
MYVEIQNYTKRIKRKTVLDHVDCGFERGEVCGLVGPNGSGKTMLLRAMCGFIRPTDGQVSIGGKPVVFNESLPERVGVLIEHPGFIGADTALGNLKYLAGLDGGLDEQETERLMKVFGIWRQRNEKVRSFSLGMRQKLAIVQALMEHQRLILLDEPTNGLDHESVLAFQREMRRQQNLGNTVIIASHHGDELREIADRILHMENGRVAN